jgi:hypothetical protein
MMMLRLSPRLTELSCGYGGDDKAQPRAAVAGDDPLTVCMYWTLLLLPNLCTLLNILKRLMLDC